MPFTAWCFCFATGGFLIALITPMETHKTTALKIYARQRGYKTNLTDE